MEKYMAVFTGSETSEQQKKWEALSDHAKSEREQAGMKAWPGDGVEIMECLPIPEM